MTGLNKRAFVGLLALFATMAAALFVPAWTLRYWQAWVFLSVFFVAALAITIYLIKRDPRLLERRIYAGPTAEKEKSQKIIQSITSLGFGAMLVVPALDHRFGWTAMPFWATLAGNVLVAIGFLIIFVVYKANVFASATIEVYPEQKVISTGLYGLVRHPMYLGGLFLFLGMCLALGSWWTFLVFLLMVPALVWRIFDEEKLLTRELPGYLEYRNQVRRRLVPLVW
jgi:protein-S-isoprenylcysteine O-methyltransferase Ste14